MTKKLIIGLAVLLVVQLVLAVTLGVTRPGPTAHEVVGSVLAFTAGEIDELNIAGADSDEAADATGVQIKRVDGAWVLPEQNNYPASAEKVDGLLTKLAGLQRKFAVATSSAAQARFKVAESDFERRITLRAGGADVGTLYLGTSPGVREVHVRNASDDAIMAVPLAVHEVGPTFRDWEDRELLQFDVAELRAVTYAGSRLERTGQQPGGALGAWTLSGLGADEVVTQTAVDDVVGQLARLRASEVLGTDSEARFGLTTPALKLTLQKSDADEEQYRFGKLESGDYVLKTSRHPYYFQVPAYTGDRLIAGLQREQLVAKADGIEAGQAGGADAVMDVVEKVLQ